MTAQIHYTIGQQTIPNLLQYCTDHQLTQFTMVADDNTYPVLGEAVARALTGQGYDVKTIVLSGPEVIANEHFIMQVLVQADTQNRTYLSVGSGTLTDITRFVSHRTKADFISIPTAPSVDGFASIGAPLVIDGLKQTVLGQPPIAIFADLPTLCASPPEMIASGFGDLLGKYTSLADWELGHLLWDEPYNAQIAKNFRTAVDACVVHADAIGKTSPEGIKSLMDGLVECGLGRAVAGGIGIAEHAVRGSRQHAARATGNKMRPCCADKSDRSDHVNVEGIVPVRPGHLGEQSAMAAACIADHDIECADNLIVLI